MSDLSLARVADEVIADAWAQVHNLIIPSNPLTVEQVVERSTVYVLDVAYLGGVVVGCSTVRPASAEEPVTVIVRILPAWRRRGWGSVLLAHALTHARAFGAVHVQTIVHASNADGLEFAVHRGFVETDRYTLEGDSVPYVHLARSLDADPGSATSASSASSERG